MSILTSTTIYVGNIQSIDDDTLRTYFQRFGDIEALYHNCTRAVDEWLIDYRFIRFSSNTDISLFISNKLDHMIGRIRLDIHSYDSVFNDETRLLSDRKICIAHTNPKLDRNVIKKAFTRYGRILNCTCVSSGNGVEYVYIEYDSINSIRSVCLIGQIHYVGRTSLAVKQALRPLQVATKIEQNSLSTNVINCNCNKKFAIFSPLYSEPRNETKNYSTSNVYPSVSNNFTSCSNYSEIENLQEPTTSLPSIELPNQQHLKNLEKEYNLIIQKDFDEITYQIDKYLHKQKQTYKKLHKLTISSMPLS